MTSTSEILKIDQQAMVWFAKLRSDKLTEQQYQLFQQWYQSDQRHRQAYQQIEMFWNDTDFNAALTVAYLANSKTSSLRFSKRSLIAPLLAIAASIVLFFGFYHPTLHCWQADYCTTVGEIKTISLQDGSQISLNSASAINVNLRNGLRQVQLLNGEAFFDVQRDPNQPFLVQAKYTTTRVLGTRFVVRQDAAFDIVTVISGLVEVSQPKQNPARLEANQQITIAASTSSNVTHITSNTANAWLKGHIMFDNTALSEVISEINRYRNGQIIIQNPSLKQLKVSGRFDINNTDLALNALQQTLPIKLHRYTNWLVVIN